MLRECCDERIKKKFKELKLGTNNFPNLLFCYECGATLSFNNFKYEADYEKNKVSPEPL